MKERIGVYICHCGINIAGKVRVEEVRDFAAGLRDVVIARDYLFMCSDPGQELIEKDIPEHNLTRIVVASCSPRMHEVTFRGAVQRGGLNPFRACHHVCIREHCSWVTESMDDATEKAKDIIRGAVNRIRFHKSLASVEYPVNPNVLIVGGGIAGMQAALDIAKGGYKAYLVERQPTIGGHMLQFDKTFPTLDCAACIGTPKMVSVGQNPHIELLTYSEVIEISGFIGNYKARIKKKARYVKENCTGCGECTKVCPVTRPSEWDVGMAHRKAIYRSFPQAVPITFVIEKKDRAPCVQSCPAGTNVQGYVALIKEGKYEDAVKLIMQNLPLPGTLARICHAPCEKECRRKEVDEPLSIRNLKRFAVDQIDLLLLPIPEIIRRKEKIAIIGSGPAGLTCAYFLALKGYSVTIFEALPVAGGMLRVGIPNYRLPHEVLDKEIENIRRLGVEIKLNKRIGKDITIDGLFQEGYRAIFLAMGTHKAYRLRIPGEDAEGVLFGVDFLREVNLGGTVKVGQKVIVIGGGNVAIDVARTALRKGGEDIHLFCLESREEMPAGERDIREALEEKIVIHNSWGPKQILLKGRRAIGVEFKRCISVFDKDRRFNPVYDDSITESHEADTIIVSIGQGPDISAIEDTEGLKLTWRNTIQVDPISLATTREGIFAGGDVCTGTAWAIDAVSAGKEAAISIDRYLNGEDLKAGRERKKEISGDWLAIPKDIEKQKRANMPELPLQSRFDFGEIELGFSEEIAKKEASRCLSCGVCSECLSCLKECKAEAIDHNMKEEIKEIDIGSIIVATGYDLMDPTPMKQFGYGKYPNVFTSLEFERLNNATGPTSGKILMRDESKAFTKPPESVAILHCIGSRDTNYHEYCSRVCCMYALKFAHLIKDKVGEHCAVYNFYIDMRCFGKGYEEFFKRVQDEGVKMIRGKAARVTDEAMDESEKGKLIVVAEDTLSGKLMRVPVDMVVLCSAIEKRADADQVARIFGISTGRDGFFLEEHPKLEPVSTATSGVFVAGACQGPKDIPDTVAQAKGAASEAMALSSRGRVEVSPMISEIDPYICIGCQVCRELCAYSAIEFDERRGVSVVNEAVCKGCGSCSAYCPSGAAKVKHFTDKQIFAEIDGLLEGIRFGHAA